MSRQSLNLWRYVNVFIQFTCFFWTFNSITRHDHPPRPHNYSRANSLKKGEKDKYNFLLGNYVSISLLYLLYSLFLCSSLDGYDTILTHLYFPYNITENEKELSITVFLIAAFMLYGPYLWCYVRKEPRSLYGLNWILTPNSVKETLFCIIVTLVPLTVIAMNWPGDHLPRSVPVKTFLQFLSAGTVAAIVEESFFRGFLQTVIVKKTGPFVGIIVVSLIFAASHLFLKVHWLRVATFFPGIVMGLLRYRHGSIAPSIIYHLAGNIWSIWFFPHMSI